MLGPGREEGLGERGRRPGDKATSSPLESFWTLVYISE